MLEKRCARCSFHPYADSRRGNNGDADASYRARCHNHTGSDGAAFDCDNSSRDAQCYRVTRTVMDVPN